MAEMQLLLDGPAMQLRCLECPIEVVPGTVSPREASTMQTVLMGWLRG